MVEFDSRQIWQTCCHKSYWIFLALLFVAPLPLGSNRPWAWGVLEVWIFLLVAMESIQGAMAGGSLREIPSRYRWALLTFILWSLYPLWQIVPLSLSMLSWLSPTTLEIRRLAGLPDAAGSISLDGFLTLQSWLKGMAYLSGFWLTFIWTNSSQRMMRLFLVLLASGTFQALYGLLMIQSDPYGTVSGTFVNRNHLAGLLEMTIPIGIGLMIGWMAPLRNSRRGVRETLLDWLHTASSRKGVLFMVIVIMILAEFMTQSRSGNASFFCALLLVSGLAGMRVGHDSTSREKRLLVPLLIVALLVGAWYGLGHLTGRLLKTDVLNDERMAVTLSSLRVFNDFKLFGSGAGTFALIYPKYRQGELTEVLLDHAHNDHVELLVEQGMVGYGLLLIAVLSAWMVMVHGYLRRRDPFLRGVLFASLTGTFALTLHGLFDFNFHIPSNALYFMVLLAMGMRASFLPAR
ncbi:MAG: O-antigen ligase family protein [Magnetococcus sp. YQC-5]